MAPSETAPCTPSWPAAWRAASDCARCEISPRLPSPSPAPHRASARSSPSPPGHACARARSDQPAGTAEPRTSRERVFVQRARVVCKRCNNGWMSDLEGANRRFLEAALHGRGSELHRGRQRALAAWAHKTAIVINAGLFRAHRTGMAPEHAHYLREQGQPPDDVGIWVTSVTAEEPAWVSSNGLALSSPGQRVSDEDPPNFS